MGQSEYVGGGGCYVVRREKRTGHLRLRVCVEWEVTVVPCVLDLGYL